MAPDSVSVEVIPSDILDTTIKTLEAYLQFGDSMQWPGMSQGEVTFLRHKIVKAKEYWGEQQLKE